MEGSLVIGQNVCTCACVRVYCTLVIEQRRYGTTRDVIVQCTSSAIFHFAFPPPPLHYPLRLVRLHHLCTHLEMLSLLPKDLQKEDGSFALPAPEMLPASNKLHMCNHFQISKCQLGSGYRALLPVWFQQPADLSNHRGNVLHRWMSNALHGFIFA